MKKIYLLLIFLFSFSAINIVNGQCGQATSNYANHAAPTSTSYVTTTTCHFGGEYANITGCIAGAVYEYTTCGDADFDTQLTVRDGYGGAVLAYNDDACGLQSTVTWTQPTNGTAVISIHKYSCTTESTCMTLQGRRVSVPSPGPVNDNCATASAIAIGGSVSGNTADPGATSVVLSCGTADGTGAELWYTFVGNGSRLSLTITAASYDTKLWLYTGCNFATDCVAGDDDSAGSGWSKIDFCSVNGQTYRVAVGGFSANEGTFTLGLTNIDANPVFSSCPSNISVNNTSGQCGAIVNYTTPTATDDCGTPTVTRLAGLASGAFFPVGTTTVTYRATDGVGRTADCSFTVTVVDNQNPTISCPANISVNATAGTCGAVVNYSTPTASDNCSGVTVAKISGLATGSTFPVGTSTVTYRATDASGRTADCSFTVTVVDNQNPTISCPANISVNATAGTCGAVVNYSTPTASDNCSGVTVAKISGLASGSTFPVGTSTVTYRATDGVGRTADCSFTVTVTDTQDPTISCPANISVNVTAGTCGKVVNYSTPTASDNCSISSILKTAGLASGSTFPIGTSTVTYRATDASGRTADCSFTVTVTDNEAPTVVCKNISVQLNASGLASIVAADVHTSSSDNCGTVNLVSVSPSSFTCANLGANTVTLTVNDGNGNTNTCNATVTITEAASTAPTSITASSSFICAGNNVTLTQAGGSLGLGASYKWYTSSCGGTLVGTGASISVSPTATTTYYVRAESVCSNGTACASTTVVVNGGNTAPNASAVLATTTSSSICVVNDALWHYYYNASGELLAAINSNGQNLGDVTITITVGDSGPFGQGLAPGVCGYPGANGGEYVMPRYWDITVDNQPSTPVDVIFFYKNSDVASLVATINAQNANYTACWGDVNLESDLMMTVAHTAGGTELFSSLNYAAGPNSSAGHRQIGFQLTQFSGGKLHSKGGLYSGNPLPVELIALTASAINNEAIQIDWTTATEINNQGFEVQRSIDGTNFEKIGWVAGNGNSNANNDYALLDKNVKTGVNYYYRLKQIDFDGEFEYSKIVKSYLTNMDKIEVSYFIPNPSSNVSSLIIDGTRSVEVQIEIMDNIGRKVASRVQTIESGKNTITFDLHDFSSGVYTARILMDKEEFTRKLVVRK